VTRVRAGVAVMATALPVWLWGRWAAPHVLALVKEVQRWGVVAPMAFVLLYAGSVVALISASLLTIAGGALLLRWQHRPPF